jgi:hypothetical protein
MHTVETCLETDDVLVLEPSGKLYMSFTKETFETFGMTAKSRSKADVRYDKHGNSYILFIQSKEKTNFKTSHRDGYDGQGFCTWKEQS